MTTSTSNASMEIRADGAATATASAEARPQASADTARTLASRFIILTLCLVVVLSALAFGTVHAWSLAIFYAGACFVICCWATDAWRTRRLRLSGNPLQLPLLGLIVLGFVQLLPWRAVPDAAEFGLPATAPLSLDPYTTRFVLVQLGALFIYFAAALAFIDSPKRLRLVVRMLIVFGFLLAAFGIIQSFVSPDKIFGVRDSTQSLGFGPFINRHHFAGCMEMLLALPLGLIFAGAVERDRYLLYGFASLLMGMALILTNSRGGMLSLVMEIMFLVIVSGAVRQPVSGRSGAEKTPGRSRAMSLALRAAVGVSIVAVLFTGVLFFGGEDALNRLVGTVNLEDPTTGRIHFWRGTVGIIRDHPLWGTGLGAFGLAYTGYDTSHGRLYRLEQAHNDYLQILSDAGVIGAVLGIVFVALLFRMAFRRMGAADAQRRGIALGALAGCFAIFVHSFVEFALHTTSNALLFLLLVALATLNGRVEQPSRKRRRRRSRGATADAVSAPVAGDGQSAVAAGPPTLRAGTQTLKGQEAR